MSENQSAVVDVLDAVSRLDLDALLAATDPEVEWWSFFSALSGGGCFRGHDGLRRYVNELAEAWEFLRVRVDDSLELGDLVLAVGELHYRGRESGLEKRDPAAWVFHFSNGLITSFRAVSDPYRHISRLGAQSQP